MIAQRGPIIFVEDDADDQLIYTEICQNLGLKNQLKFFERGQLALEYLRRAKVQPLIIICDINMPEMDGLELRKQINEEENLRRKSIPFVFLSTSATRDQVKKAYDLTVQGFFIKEQNFTETEETFRKILAYWSKCYHPNSGKGSDDGDD